MTKLVQKTISMPCDSSYLHDVRELLNETLAETKLSRRDKDLVILAIDEAISSEVQYARYKDFHNEITLSIDVNDVRFKARIVDSLKVFDLGPGNQIAERLAGERNFTMGFFLMRQIMDEITYVYRKGFQNDLELIKFL